MYDASSQRWLLHRHLALLVLVSVGCVGADAWASERSADEAESRARLLELSELPFEQLLRIKITTPSKRDEWIVDAPGIVSVITTQEIEAYGGNNLLDLLARVPGVFPFGSAKFRDNVLSIRGQTSTHIDTHVLILVNGRPTRESLAAGFNSAIYRGFPVTAIERIEVIRGPGSVIYGTGAFSGVVNIITKDTTEDGPSELSIGYGSNDTILADGRLARKWGDFSLGVSGKVLDSDGWKFSAVDQDGVDNSVDYSQQDYGVFAEARYRDLTLTAFTVGNTDTVLNLPPRFPVTRQGDIVHRRHFVDLGYTYKFSKSWRAELNTTFNARDFIDKPNSVDLSVYDFLVEPAVQGLLFDQVSVLLGGQYERLNGSVPGAGDYALNRFRFYGQFDYSPWDFLKIVAGLQVNKSDGVDVNLSPRAAIIISKGSIGAKILYGEAFRSPAVNEQRIDIPNLSGNPDLEPETIQTFSAQIHHSSRHHFAAVTYFRSEVREAIQRIGAARPFEFANTGSIHYQGVELEGKAVLPHGFDLQGSFSYQENKEHGGRSDVGLIANYMLKLGVSYQTNRGISLGLFNSYFSDAAKLEGAAKVNPAADAFSWMTLNLSIDARKLLARSDIPDVRISLFIDNLLDERVYFPEFQARRINTLPLRGGIAAYGHLTISF